MQASTAHDHYLYTEVGTAAPQKLQLLLIEAALRLANRARQFRRQSLDDRAVEAIAHARSILAEMRAGIKYEIAGVLGERISAVYEFIFRCLMNAGCRHDEKSLDDAIRILEIERETWRQVCGKLAMHAPHETFGEALQGVLPSQNAIPESWSSAGGFSIEV